MERLLEIVAEDEEFLVLNKPAGLVCHPTKGDEYSSLISRARLYLKNDKPHLINRLDRETSGLVVIAKQVEAAARLRKLWENREVEKEYRAVVYGRLDHRAITVSAPLGPDTESEVVIRDRVVENGTEAVTRIYPLRSFDRTGAVYSFVRLVPLTGRKHQLRIHLSHIGHPIVGDKLYGPDPDAYLAFVRGVLTQKQRDALVTEHHALHAGHLRFNWRGAARTYSCPPEPWFREFASC